MTQIADTDTTSAALDDAFDTDVLVVGSGPAGISTAVFLAQHGVDVTVVTRVAWAADSPRAHITNQRTMEVLRAAGLEPAARAVSQPREVMANQILCTSVAGEEFGRVWSWGNDPARAGEYITASPTPGCDLPQDRLEPILLAEAGRLGVHLRFLTRFDGLEQDDDGVTARVTDLKTEREGTIRARYLVGADGGRSKVAEEIGLTLLGESGIADAANVEFIADLSPHVAHRPGSLFQVIQPERPEGVGIAMIRMVEPWRKWSASLVYLGNRNGRFSTEEAEQEIRTAIGDDSIDVEVTGIFAWRINHVVAEQYSVGRVLCAGDAVHRHPPMNGLGANTCIQDAFNLAWKLAYVLKGHAGPGLLDTYSAERQPVGKQIVDRAIGSWHLGREIYTTLGIEPGTPLDERTAEFALLKDTTAAGEARRAAFADVLRNKAYVYSAHGVEMNQRYRSGAVVGDGTTTPFERDPELYIQPTSDPGARVPHCWVGSAHETVSTLDLTSPLRFTLLTRARGAKWTEAAAEIAAELGIELKAFRIAPDGDVQDLYGDFANVSQIGEDGCLLVRPDQHVAWRSAAMADDPEGELRRVLTQVLDRAA